MSKNTIDLSKLEINEETDSEELSKSLIKSGIYINTKYDQNFFIKDAIDSFINSYKNHKDTYIISKGFSTGSLITAIKLSAAETAKINALKEKGLVKTVNGNTLIQGTVSVLSNINFIKENNSNFSVACFIVCKVTAASNTESSSSTYSSYSHFTPKTIDEVNIYDNTIPKEFLSNIEKLGYTANADKVSTMISLVKKYMVDLKSDKHYYILGRAFGKTATNAHSSAREEATAEYIEDSLELSTDEYELNDAPLLLCQLILNYNGSNTDIGDKKYLSFELYNFKDLTAIEKDSEKSDNLTEHQEAVIDKIQNNENLTSEEATELSDDIQIAKSVDSSASTSSNTVDLPSADEVLESVGANSTNTQSNNTNSNVSPSKQDINELFNQLQDDDEEDDELVQLLNDDSAQNNLINSATSSLSYDSSEHKSSSTVDSKTKILKRFDNTLNYKPIQIDDIDSLETSLNNYSQALGEVFPVIRLNGHIFNDDHIERMELIETGFIPKINVTINDLDGVLSTIIFPTSKCTLELYLKSKNANLKSVRCDFIIDSMTPTIQNGYIANEQSKNAIGNMYLISGTMSIPKMFNTEINSYTGSSYDVLQKIASDLNLGFSTNETLTNDKMTWIQPNERFDTFIQDVVSRAYKDEDSFYQAFVDIYGNLTFVNYSYQLSQDSDPDTGYSMDTIYSSDINNFFKDQNVLKKDASSGYSFFLSNYSLVKGSPSYVRSLSTKTNQGSTMLYSPRTKNISYYDIQQSNDNSKKFVSYNASPINLIKSKESLDNNVSTTWEGIESGNVHDNYIYSKYNNIQNFNELNKCTAKIITDGVNLNIIRGQRIPVYIIREDPGISMIQDVYINSEENEKRKKESDDNQQGATVDKKNTGYYIVKDIKIIYSKYDESYPTRFITEMNMYRSEWPENEVIIGSDEEEVALNEELNAIDQKDEQEAELDEQIKEQNASIDESSSSETSSTESTDLQQIKTNDSSTTAADANATSQESEYITLADGRVRKRKKYKVKDKDPNYNSDELFSAIQQDIANGNTLQNTSSSSTSSSDTGSVGVSETVGENSAVSGTIQKYLKELGASNSADSRTVKGLNSIIEKNEPQLLANIVSMKSALKSYGISLTLTCTTGGTHSYKKGGTNATHAIGAKADLSVFYNSKKVTAANVTRDILIIIHNCALSCGLKSQFETQSVSSSSTSGWIDVRLARYYTDSGSYQTVDSQFNYGKYYFLMASPSGNHIYYYEPKTFVNYGMNFTGTYPSSTSTSSSSSSKGKYSLSNRGKEFIRKQEGCKLTAYFDSNNVPTIGYGHTGNDVTKDDVKNKKTISQSEANSLFDTDSVTRVNSANNLLSSVSLNQNQFDALVSFIYNNGVGGFKDSSLYSAVKENPNNKEKISECFRKYVYCGNKVLAGLEKRREDEITLYFS